MAYSVPQCSFVINGELLLARISSMNELVQVKVKFRNLSLLQQFMPGIALLDKIGKTCSKMAYNGPIFV